MVEVGHLIFAHVGVVRYVNITDDPPTLPLHSHHTEWQLVARSNPAATTSECLDHYKGQAQILLLTSPPHDEGSTLRRQRPRKLIREGRRLLR